MDNIVLIGMPGSGKSTIGVLLAKNLAFQFIDSDLVIQEKTGMRLQKYIDQYGTEAFSRLEDQINSEIQADHAVIATGGSAVYGKNAMRHFSEIATVVYLRVSFGALQHRIKDFSTRGIVVPNGKTFQDVYKERVPLYEQYADVTVDTEGKEFWDVVEEITLAVNRYKAERE